MPYEIDSPQKVAEIGEKVAELKSGIYLIMEVVVKGVTKKDPKDIPKDLIHDLDQLALSVCRMIKLRPRMLIILSEILNRSSPTSM